MGNPLMGRPFAATAEKVEAECCQSESLFVVLVIPGCAVALLFACPVEIVDAGQY
jgi:hypothetical protein